MALFGLAKEDILPILSTACGLPVTDFSIRSEASKTSQNGIFGEYVLPRFAAETAQGDRIDVTLFVRRQRVCAKGKRQAHHYTFLASHGVPVPFLYGPCLDSEGREILFLEPLEEVLVDDDAFLGRSSDAESFLDTMAAFNAVRPTVDYASEIGRDVASRDYVQNWGVWLPWSIHVLTRIEEHVAGDAVGKALREYCVENAARLRSLKELVLALVHAMHQLPLGLVHGDFTPCNTGWRRSPRELVVFDFEDVMIDVRFCDVGRILGGPRPLIHGTRSNADLLDYYLASYQRRGGAPVSREELEREASLAWYAYTVNLWGAFPAELGGPAYTNPAFAGADREERLELLYSNLCMLMDRAPVVAELLRP